MNTTVNTSVNTSSADARALLAIRSAAGLMREHGLNREVTNDLLDAHAHFAATPPAVDAQDTQSVLPGAVEAIKALCEMQERWLASVVGKPSSRAIATIDTSNPALSLRGEDDYDNEAFAVRQCAADVGHVITKLEAALARPQAARSIEDRSHEIQIDDGLDDAEPRPQAVQGREDVERWLDADWPLWRNDPDHPAVQRVRRAWDAAQASDTGRGEADEAHRQAYREVAAVPLGQIRARYGTGDLMAAVKGRAAEIRAATRAPEDSAGKDGERFRDLCELVEHGELALSRVHDEVIDDFFDGLADIPAAIDEMAPLARSARAARSGHPRQ